MSNLKETDQNPVKVEIQSKSGRIIGKGNYGMKTRALWYLKKDLADVVEDTDDFFKVRLRFEPQRWLDELRRVRYSYLFCQY